MAAIMHNRRYIVQMTVQLLVLITCVLLTHFMAPRSLSRHLPLGWPTFGAPIGEIRVRRAARAARLVNNSRRRHIV